MRRWVVTWMALSSACTAGAAPLPVFMAGDADEGLLPGANLPIDTYRPIAAGQLPSTLDPAQRPALDLNARVHLRKVRFEGGTVYPLSDLREHFQPLIGQDVTLGQLVAYTDRLSQRYQQDGYWLSHAYLMPQDLADGRVSVVLVEGYVSDCEIHGDIGPAKGQVEQLLARLKTERPLTRQAFERYIGLIERIPGVAVQARLVQPGGNGQAMRLVVQVARKPVATAMTFTDGSRDSPQALLRVASQAQTRFAEQLSAAVLVPPGKDEARYWRLDYSQFVDDEGSQVLASARRYRSDSSTRIRLDHGGYMSRQRDNERYSVGISQALIVAADESLDALARFEVGTDRSALQAEGSGRHSDEEVDLRVLSFEADWRKREAGRLRLVSGSVHQGLDQLGARGDGEVDLDFLRLHLAGVQSDTWPGNWQGVLSGALYWSDDHLPDSERAVFGGQNFARGYPVDQAAGDKGWGLAYEIGYRLRRDGAWFDTLHPYAALDTARAWFNRGGIEQARLGSVAMGLRLGNGEACSLALEVAKPLADIALDSLGRQPRLSLSIRLQL
ncbi:ShlB/FhaC/HecB family hemolysin secretion/activation protein [Pseudomonas sp. S31]|uniref:ShlB/FhaC/HecB family hemolysin secretion/activation protein n=1 Tax=Pseudomonas sp. S31 TaxID=1564473 RepID=UPI001913435E|nr:ShlB/FhaC/HecB family hemolysin secretion/activation protein [Pseudomonas sp. S31]MBK5003129.1 ShlB/FhaC/HecB family hemolysin secretion/activation protein [Pseudomonas sp. S31]